MMKTKTRGIILGIAAALISSSAMAQFALDGQYRPRTEFRNGFKKPIVDGQSPAAFVEHRARLTAAYKSEKVGFKLSIQDVRIWGEVGQINKSDQLLSAHEAYGDYYASEKSTFRVGRQEVVYDGARFFGNLDWAMQGRALDAVRYLYKDGVNQFDLMAAWNQTGFGDGAPEPAKLFETSYSTMNGGGANPRIFNLGLPKAQFMAYYKRSFDFGTVAIMASNDNYHPTDTVKYSDFTIGISPDFTFGEVKAGGQFYYTGGKASNTIDLGGYMANIYVQLPKLFGSPLIGIDYVSGDDETTTEIEGWNPKYGTNHKFYGFMDYFFVGNGHGGANARSAGLMDIHLKTAFKLGEKTSLLGHLHYFASTAERTFTSGSESKAYKGGLGTELDLVISHKLADALVLKAGYSQMFGVTETMKMLKYNNPNQEVSGVQNWAWVMLAFSPKFL